MDLASLASGADLPLCAHVLRTCAWPGRSVMVALAPVLYGSSDFIARIYTEDAAVVAIATPGLGLGAWILLVDASQAS